MLGLLVSLLAPFLALCLPGYALLSTKHMRHFHNFDAAERFLFGSVMWWFYIIVSTAFARLLVPNPLSYFIEFNFVLGIVFTAYWILETYVSKGVLSRFIDKIMKLPSIKSQFGLSALSIPYLFGLLLFVLMTTIYTPIILQYDALSSYLPIARSLEKYDEMLMFPSLVDRPPTMPILYGFVYHLSGLTSVRVIPLLFLALLLTAVYKIGENIDPETMTVRLVAVISVVAMLGVHLYFSNWSLYADLGLLFFLTCTCYALMLMFDGRKNSVVFAVLGFAGSLAILSKEVSVFYLWIFIWLLITTFRRNSFRNRHIPERLFWISLLVLPLVIYHIAGSAIFTPRGINISGITFFRFLLLPFFFLAFLGIGSIGHFKHLKWNFRRAILVAAPTALSVVYLVYNTMTIGSPFGSYWPPYKLILKEMGITLSAPTAVADFDIFNSIIGVSNFFLSNTVVAPNLVLLILGLLVPPFTLRRHHKRCKYQTVTYWFTFSVLLFAFLDLNILEGGAVRSLIPLTVPTALLVAMGVRSLVVFSRTRDSYGPVIYGVISSISLFYIWTIIGDGTSWWLRNQRSIASRNPLATAPDLLFFLSLWAPFLLYAFLKNFSVSVKVFSVSKFNSSLTRGLKIVIMASTLLSALVPLQMVGVASGYVANASWNIDYPNKPEAILDYTGSHSFIEIIDYYRNNLAYNEYVTVGVGVSPFDFILNRPFLDLQHPRNIIKFSPLLTSVDTKDLFTYLSELNIKYFLIPTDASEFRIKTFRSISSNSTLFALIRSSEEFYFPSNLGNFTFVRLESFQLYELYALQTYSPQITDIIKGEPRVFWNSSAWGEGNVGVPVISDHLVDGWRYSRISIPSGKHSVWAIFHSYEEPKNWSKQKYLCLRWFGKGSNLRLHIVMFGPTLKDKLWYSFDDDYVGWRTISIPLDQPSDRQGSPERSSVIYVGIRCHNPAQEPRVYQFGRMWMQDIPYLQPYEVYTHTSYDIDKD